MPEVKAQFRVGNEHVASDLGKIHQDFKAFSNQTVREIERTQRLLEQQLGGAVPTAAGFKRYGMRAGMPGNFPMPPMPDFMKNQNFFKRSVKAMSDQASFMKDMTFLMMPLMNPGSVWATLFSTRQTFSAMTKTGMGRKMAGGTLGGAALMTAGLVGGATALGVAFGALRKTVSEVISAYDRAKGLYSQSLMAGGLNIGFVTRRSMAANAMGVSERDVLQFGRALAYLNPKLEWSAGILAKTTPNLTSVSWEMNILKDNLAAMFATLANDAAPYIRKFIDSVSQMVKWLTNLYTAARDSFPAIKAVLGQVFGVIAGPGLKNFFSLLGTASQIFGKDSGPAPDPIAYMKQMKASNWERMGLVIGGGGANNPAKETAKHTKQMVTLLGQIYKGLVPRGGMDPGFNVAQSHL